MTRSGTGKTYASAFAMRELGFKRVLFLVHRGQLARQTKKSYEKVFGNTVFMGLVGGGYYDYDKDYIFATVQTINRDAHLLKYKPNEEYELKSSTLDVLHYVFTEEEPKASQENYYKILGLVEGKRAYRWIERKYMTPRYPENNNIDKYKVFIPKASGSGQFGETLSAPVVANPGVSSTPTFISIGKFESLLEAENAAKYIRTKFVRALLGVLKITQDIVPSKWRYVPAQIFGEKSDIDWTRPIQEIDEQLYKKYGFDETEIEFIETNVKEMD